MNARQAALRRRIRQVRRFIRAGMISVQRAGAALAVALGQRRTPPLRPARWAGHGLSAVNAVTFTALFGNVLGLDPWRAEPRVLLGTMVLALCCATAQTVLAVDAGRRLRPRPGTSLSPELPPPGLIGVGVLALTGGLGCVATVEWAGSAGALLGASVLVAPFLLIADEVGGPRLDAARSVHAGPLDPDDLDLAG